jgi:hypothetical protein
MPNLTPQAPPAPAPPAPQREREPRQPDRVALKDFSAHAFVVNDNALGSLRYPPFAQSSAPQYSKNIV